jgi:hypothetical protein
MPYFKKDLWTCYNGTYFPMDNSGHPMISTTECFQLGPENKGPKGTTNSCIFVYLGLKSIDTPEKYRYMNASSKGAYKAYV